MRKKGSFSQAAEIGVYEYEVGHQVFYYIQMKRRSYRYSQVMQVLESKVCLIELGYLFFILCRIYVFRFSIRVSCVTFFRSRSHRRSRMLQNNAHVCSNLHELFEYL